MSDMRNSELKKARERKLNVQMLENYWLLVMRILNKKYCKKDDFPDVNKSVLRFVFSELVRMGYIKKYSETTLHLQKGAQKRRFSNYKIIRDYDLKLFHYMWHIDVSILLEKTREVEHQLRLIHYVGESNKSTIMQTTG